MGQNPVVKKLNEDKPLDFESYAQDTEAYGLGTDGKYGYGKYKIGKSVDSLEPMAVIMHPSPSKALREPYDRDSSSDVDDAGAGAGAGARPSTASFAYLRACSQHNVAPWNLVTKCEDPASPTLNLKGLAMGGGFADCLSEGLQSRSMEFLEKVDLSDNR